MSVATSRIAVRQWNRLLCALRQTDAAQGGGRGPLGGLAISVKDMIDVRGWVTSCNHRPFANRVADQDARLIALLREAGANLIGQSGTLEFAYGGFSDEALYSHARNPWRFDRSPGGSSAGAGAAAAAGLCDTAVATDTSGSVRGPAANCGVLGLKFTHDAVDMAGVYPLAPSLDSIGVLSAEVEPMRATTEVLIGPRPSRQALRRIARVRSFDKEAGLASGVDKAIDGALAVYSSESVEVKDLVLATPLRDYHAACIVVLLYEAWHVHSERLRSECDGYDPWTWGRLALGAFVEDADYQAAWNVRIRLRAELDEALERYDLLVWPTAPGTAPPTATAPMFSMLEQRFLTAPASLTGHPALSLPIGFDAEGLPVAMQLVARHGGEGELIEAAQLWRKTSGWTTRMPVVPTIDIAEFIA